MLRKGYDMKKKMDATGKRMVLCMQEEKTREVQRVKLTAESECAELKRKMLNEKEKKQKVQRRVHVLNRRVQKLKEKVKDAKESVMCARRDCAELLLEKDELKEKCEERVQEQIEAFLMENDVCTFKNGRYEDSVREVYQDLMTMNVGAKNVEKVVRIV
jgi:chromosome segregation ATPase